MKKKYCAGTRQASETAERIIAIAIVLFLIRSLMG